MSARVRVEVVPQPGTSGHGGRHYVANRPPHDFYDYRELDHWSE